VLRRGNRSGRAVLQVSDLELDRITHGVHRQGRQIDLSPKEFSLLELLMRHGSTRFASGDRGASLEVELRHHD
jgi:DNA-binding response OmpR family regulator